MAGRPIPPSSVLSFLKSFEHRWTWRNLGICVSGGADSMALAYLLRESQLLQPGKSDMDKPLGLIVDHKARPESTHEAHAVQENLHKIGVESKVLTMTWPEGIDPLQLSDFESQARTKRYQLLARAARKHNIRHLFLGHHQDDQVETMLMRLIRNRKISLSGLAGMATTAPIPAELNLPGVHTMSRYVSFPAPNPFAPSLDGPGAQKNRNRFNQVLAGGMLLQRPLLAYSKADLIATCKANRVSYIDDPTNIDPTLNPRNAIRHLRRHHNLPEALNSERILSLQSTARARLESIEAAGENILSNCKIDRLDYRSGVVKLNIPFGQCTSSVEANGYAYAVSRLTEIITPNSRIDHSVQIPPHVLSHFCSSHGFRLLKATSHTTPTSFVHDRVQFVADETSPHTWLLSRQPMRQAEVVENTQHFSIDEETLPLPKHRHASHWLLWDNRFWIRVGMGSRRPLDQLEIRPLKTSDLDVAASWPVSSGRDFKFTMIKLLRVMREAAPGKIRFTMPVLTFEGRLVAFPTLGIRLYDLLQANGLPQLHWEVCYNAFSLVKNRHESNSLLPTSYAGPSFSMYERMRQIKD